MGIEVIQMISCNPCPKIGALTPKNWKLKYQRFTVMFLVLTFWLLGETGQLIQFGSESHFRPSPFGISLNPHKISVCWFYVHLTLVHFHLIKLI